MSRISVRAVGCAIAVVWLACPAEAAQYPYGAYGPSASVRLQVEPKETEVFVDGYWVGTVDDFDGFFQRLHLVPGEHEIELSLVGYRNLRQRVYLQPHGTFRLRHRMEPLAPGEVQEARPGGSERSGRSESSERSRGSERSERSERSIGSGRSAFGTLALRVQPADAEVLIDGRRWDASGQDRLVVELPAGVHRVEVRKEGFAAYAREVRVRAGDRTTLNVSLARE